MVSLFEENTFYFGLYWQLYYPFFTIFFFLEPTDLSKLLGSIYKVGVFLFLKTALVKTNKWLNSFWTVHMILLSVLAKWPQALCTSILVVEKKETQWLKLRLRGPSRAVYRIRVGNWSPLGHCTPVIFELMIEVSRRQRGGRMLWLPRSMAGS